MIVETEDSDRGAFSSRGSQDIPATLCSYARHNRTMLVRMSRLRGIVESVATD